MTVSLVWVVAIEISKQSSLVAFSKKAEKTGMDIKAEVGDWESRT
ncbi:MAG: hypothetical protein R2760_00150 [Chitinophagales bacterium]